MQRPIRVGHVRNTMRKSDSTEKQNESDSDSSQTDVCLDAVIKFNSIMRELTRSVMATINGGTNAGTAQKGGM